MEELEKRDQLMTELRQQHSNSRQQVDDMTRRITLLDSQLREQSTRFESEKASLQARLR
jgi:uncharacterized protein involved in exopolysaccharide biosynthesis